MRLYTIGTLAIPLALLVTSGCGAGRNFGAMDTPAKWREVMQPPLSATEEAQLANPSLHDVLIVGLSRNPGVVVARERWLAAIHREPQATSLPDPMLSAGYQFQSVETRVGPQRWSAGLAQKLPWWQKLWAGGKLAATRANVARLRYEAAMRDLIINIKDSWYELYYLDHAIPVTASVEQQLRDEGLLAYTELDTGRAQLGEAFRAESQAAQLTYDRLLLVEQRDAQAEHLRSLLNLPPGTSIARVERAPTYPVSNDVEALHARAERYSEVLKISGLEIERSEYETYLARLSRIPDLSLGFNWINTGAARLGSPADSGKNPFIGLFSMNLPIWDQRNRALIREKEAMEDAMRHDAMAKLNRTRAAVAQTYFQVRLTQRLVDLYAQTLLPQAESVMSQAEVDYRAEEGAYSGVLETTIAYHNFLLAWYRAQSDYGQAIGRLERVLGATAQTPPEVQP